MKNEIKKALIYCRVSTEEQAKEGYSLDAQENFCRKFAEENGYKVVEVYRDEGKSGTNLNRPALQNLLDRCQDDKSINAVIVQETDRLARNTKDHLTIRAILKKAGVIKRSQIKFIVKPFIAVVFIIPFYLLTSFLNVYLQFVMIVVLYVILIVVLKIFDQEEIRIFKRYISNKLLFFKKHP